MKKTYTGGCHCGAVRYEVDADLSQGTIKCNCSICSKSRAWLIGVSKGDLRVLQGADSLTDYRFNTQRIDHRFCSRCGIKCFGQAAAEGGDFVAVMVNTLDGVADADLAALPVMYVDGRHDNFKAPPQETRHL